MKKNKNILVLFGLIMLPTHVPQILYCDSTSDKESQVVTTSPYPQAYGPLAITGVLVNAAGTALKLYGLYVFLSNINCFISKEKLADYNKHELAALNKEKLATLIAQEEKRIKEKREGVKKILIGFSCESVGILLAGGQFAPIWCGCQAK